MEILVDVRLSIGEIIDKKIEYHLNRIEELKKEIEDYSNIILLLKSNKKIFLIKENDNIFLSSEEKIVKNAPLGYGILLCSITSDFDSLDHLRETLIYEEQCKSYYERARWADNVICPHCGYDKVYRTNRGFKCGNFKCHSKFTVLTGTIFENTKIPLLKWFSAIFLYWDCDKKISSVELSKRITTTQKTAWGMLSHIRGAFTLNLKFFDAQKL